EFLTPETEQLVESAVPIGTAIGLVGVAAIATAFSLIREKMHSTLKELSLLDELTGLRNRRDFRRQMSEMIEKSDQQRMQFAVIFIDVDHFKKINDTYGHLSGDMVLKNIANTFQNYM